jgi:phage FluMu gp28-like protein
MERVAVEPLSDEQWEELREESRQSFPEALSEADDLPDLLLSYQATLLATTAVHALVVCEKSRRIGVTWGIAADAVLASGAKRSAGGMDSFYIGYNLDMAREFIDVCAMWARAFMPAASEVQEFIFVDQDEDRGGDKHIQAFRIRFASSFEIVALSSRPRSLRGRQGYVIIDEAAFHDALDELIKAAIALLMWGGKVLVISTHDGQDNPFNELIQDIRAGKRKGEVVKITFDDAIAAGLYERIALVTGKPDTPEAKAEWIAGIRAFYAADASEELDVIPKAGSGAFLSGPMIQACMTEEHYVARLECPDGFHLRPKIERRAFVDDWLETHVEPHLKRFPKDRRSYFGEDFGRTINLTVIPFGYEARNTTLIVPLIVELKNTPIAQQQQVLSFVVPRLPRFSGGKMDATGNGLGLAEWAQEEFGHRHIEAVKMSTNWYLTVMPKLKGHFEDKSIEIPLDADTKDDLRTLRLIRGVAKLPETNKDGRHGDGAIGLGMFVDASEMEVGEIAYTSASTTASRPMFGADDDDDDNWTPVSQRGAW